MKPVSSPCVRSPTPSATSWKLSRTRIREWIEWLFWELVRFVLFCLIFLLFQNALWPFIISCICVVHNLASNSCGSCHFERLLFIVHRFFSCLRAYNLDYWSFYLWANTFQITLNRDFQGTTNLPRFPLLFHTAGLYRIPHQFSTTRTPLFYF